MLGGPLIVQGVGMQNSKWVQNDISIPQRGGEYEYYKWMYNEWSIDSPGKK